MERLISWGSLYIRNLIYEVIKLGELIERLRWLLCGCNSRAKCSVKFKILLQSQSAKGKEAKEWTFLCLLYISLVQRFLDDAVTVYSIARQSILWFYKLVGNKTPAPRRNLFKVVVYKCGPHPITFKEQ